MLEVPVKPMSEKEFAPFGNLIDFDRTPDFHINDGMCARFHGLAISDIVGDDGKTGISLGRATPYQLPLKLNMMERHPLGSQAFIPLQDSAFLVVVAPDDDGQPGNPLAFITQPKQGVQYHRNIWHAVLTPLTTPADFIIVDRIGAEPNLEEHFFDQPYLIGELEA